MMEKPKIAQNTPEGIVDFEGGIPSSPEGWQPELPTPEDLKAIYKLMFKRKLIDPIDQNEFEAHEMKDIYRFGWYRTNLGVSVGKSKEVGSYPLDANLLPPIIGPTTFFTGADYSEWHHALRFFIKTPSNASNANKLPKYLREWHKEDVAILRQNFMECMPYLESRSPKNLGLDWNIFQYNRHYRDVQRAHHLSALSWQMMEHFERAKGFKASEIDAWCSILCLEILHADPENPPSRELFNFVAWRIKELVDLESFNSLGYQNYMLRFTFLAYYLGNSEEGWDSACEISKLRGQEFTKSPMYDYVIEMRDEPQKFADLFEENPGELLTYFRL